MFNDDEEIESGDELEQQQAPVEGETPEGGEAAAAEPTEAQKNAALEAQIRELTGKVGVFEKLAPLAEAWLAKQAAAPEGGSAPDPAALASYGKQLQEAILTKTPEEAGAFLIQTLDSISKRNISAEATRLGTPLAEKAGNYTVAAFLSEKRDELGEGKAKAHEAISKAFRKSLNSAELAWLGSLNATEAQQRLEERYLQVAGGMWVNAPTAAKAPDMSGGNRGGSSGGGGGAFPNVPAKELRRIQTLVETYWPDKPAQGVPGTASYVPAVDNSKLRATKLRETIEQAGVGA